MKKGYALTVGLNSVDPDHYQGWIGRLFACEFDAKDMARLLSAKGFVVDTLLTKAATRDAVLNSIRQSARSAESGDVFVFSNSSHGSQLPDQNSDEPDGLDETICMYDGQITDDELYAAFGLFKAGVRILVLSDSCHSGTIARGPSEPVLEESPRSSSFIEKGMPQGIQARTYYANKLFYDTILLSEENVRARDGVKASILQISACMDNQIAKDGAFNGLFTGTLLRVWNGGKFNENYKKFWKKITSLMPDTQSPNYFWATDRNIEFEQEIPFTI